ncbi:insulin-like growth factor binding proteinn-terminal [Anaeramoeba ignava]|uniref:Insulin-like growth factor binding proteinn-terminal n=1 Tax=Anaeramoeba ignava TaxID=1746090 RepID=A0A9Q0LCS8_ANAIG|nr:insulin-like growth factor binding proteinn-terminal [Anaeramoeba ignava]|eukprot:Anaeramoba_ignava/a478902_193.p1 GENE.a478902_193~~a478902_193.p1  ORF type:complete len:1158 (-),score=167.81 a478902_193:22-3495(-)
MKGKIYFLIFLIGIFQIEQVKTEGYFSTFLFRTNENTTVDFMAPKLKKFEGETTEIIYVIGHSKDETLFNTTIGNSTGKYFIAAINITNKYRGELQAGVMFGNSTETVTSADVDSEGNLVVVGRTTSAEFLPEECDYTTNQTFILRLNPTMDWNETNKLCSQSSDKEFWIQNIYTKENNTTLISGFLTDFDKTGLCNGTEGTIFLAEYSFLDHNVTKCVTFDSQLQVKVRSQVLLVDKNQNIIFGNSETPQMATPGTVNKFYMGALKCTFRKINSSLTFLWSTNLPPYDYGGFGECAPIALSKHDDIWVTHNGAATSESLNAIFPGGTGMMYLLSSDGSKVFYMSSTFGNISQIFEDDLGNVMIAGSSYLEGVNFTNQYTRFHPHTINCTSNGYLAVFNPRANDTDAIAVYLSGSITQFLKTSENTMHFVGQSSCSNTYINISADAWVKKRDNILVSAAFYTQEFACQDGMGGSSFYFCTECQHGYESNQTGYNECVKCPDGYITNSIQKSCYACPKGTFSNNSYECTICPSGSWNNLTAQTACIECPVGTSSVNNSINDTCINCKSNTYAPEEGSTECKTCPEFTVSFYGSQYCTICGFGTYNSSEDTDHCTPCPDGTVSNNYRYPSCDSCPPGKQPNEWNTLCEPCPVGYFSSDWEQKMCYPCPEGYFSNVVGATSCYECTEPGICLGMNNCKEGHDPESMCINCIPGYFHFNKECKKCPNDSNVIFVAFVCFIFLICAAVFFFAGRGASFPAFTMFGSVAQMFGAIFTMDMHWPPVIKNFFRYFFGIFNFDFDSMTSPECSWNLDFYDKWIAMFFIPFIFIFIFGIIYLIMLCYYCRTANRYRKMDRFKNRSIYVLTLMLKFMYVPLAVIALKPFAYSTNNGQKVLTSDPTIKLGSAKWRTFLAVFIVAIVLYVIGIPIFFFIIIRKALSSEHSNVYKARYGWLYARYRENRYWWELVDLTFKLLLVIFALFLPGKNSVRPILLLILIGSMITLISVLKPYKPTKKHLTSPYDKLMIGLYLELFAVVWLSWSGFGVWIFFILHNIAVGLISFGIYYLWRRRKKKKLARRLKEEKDKINKLSKFSTDYSYHVSTKLDDGIEMSTRSTSDIDDISKKDNINEQSNDNKNNRNNDNDQLEDISLGDDSESQKKRKSD